MRAAARSPRLRSMADCPKCGRANEGKATVCAACGAVLPEEGPKRATLVPPGGAVVPPASAPVVKKVFCPQCGAPVTPGVAFCGRCGNKAGE